MFYGLKEGKVNIGSTDMDYVTFGKGQKVFIMIPGLADGLKTVKGTGAFLALAYRLFVKEYKVYIFSRKNHIEEGYFTKDMARDQKTAMEVLGIKSACVLGISQGGMIAQHLAIDSPEMVDKLVIAVSTAKHNDLLRGVVSNWIAMAEKNDYSSLITDTMEKVYTEERLRKYRLFYPILRRAGKPKSFERFIIQAQACISHNALSELEKISCPVLVISGGKDKIVGENAGREIAERIKQSKLIIYEEHGHGVYDEAGDFNRQVLDFISDSPIQK